MDFLEHMRAKMKATLQEGRPTAPVQMKVEPLEVRIQNPVTVIVQSPPVIPLAPAPAPQQDTRRKKKHLSKKFREDVWDRYIGREIAIHLCLCCKRTKIEKTNFQCGHVVSEKEEPDRPISVENFRPICSGCNFSMGSMNMIEYVKQYGYYIG
jgi:hypothetical protein